MRRICSSTKLKYDWMEAISNRVKHFEWLKNMEAYFADIRLFDRKQGIIKDQDKNIDPYYLPSDSIVTISYNSSCELRRSMILYEEENKESDYFSSIFGEENTYEFLSFHDNKSDEKTEFFCILKPKLSRLNDNMPTRSYSHVNGFKNNTFVHTILNQNLLSVYKETNDYQRDKIKIDLDEISMKKCLFHYKEITQKIENHLQDKTNLYYMILEIFKNEIISKNANAKYESEEGFQELTTEIKLFLDFFVELIIQFYDFVVYKQLLRYYIFTQENITNFVTTLLFNSPNFQNFYDEIVYKIHKKTEELILTRYELLNECDPQHFEVSPKFCLNKVTIEYINSKIKAITYDKNINFLPYEKSINIFRKAKDFKSPLHKLKLILLTSEMILEEIKDFYDKFKIKMDDPLGGDDFFGIFVYIASRAKIKGLFSQCIIINEFLTPNLSFGLPGYHIRKLREALDYILGLRNIYNSLGENRKKLI